MNLSKSHPPVSFATGHLIIQRHSKEDADSLFAAATESIEQVYPFLPWCHPGYSREDAVSWLAQCTEQWRKQEGHYAFAIYAKHSGRFIGGCGLNRIDDHPVCNLGYWIRSSETGKGYASEATTGLVKYGFEQLGLLRIEIMMSVENSASRRVAEKSAGVFEGRLKHRLLLHDKPHDVFLYALTSMSTED